MNRTVATAPRRALRAPPRAAMPGSFIGGGIELFRRKGMQLSAEVGYDTWAVDVESGSFAGTVEPGQRLLSVSVTW